ncbi:ras guanine nucleotide exchange factor domain-containing protein [Globomyces pollinis-pini]|nr:ras guanine nucleotide exchange factor domain-containing protein [Globomyces pollinis-pini]
MRYLEIVQAAHDYEADEQTLLGFNAGDFIYVYEKQDSGWWKGSVRNHSGWFPSNWVQPVYTIGGKLDWVQYTKETLPESKINWESLVNEIRTNASDLINLSQNNRILQLKDKNNQIIQATKHLFKYSGTLSSDAEIFETNAELRESHQKVLLALAKVQVATKIATGVWAPTDSMEHLQLEINQLLNIVRDYFSILYESGIELDYNNAEQYGDFDINGMFLTSKEIVTCLEFRNSLVLDGITTLITMINHKKTSLEITPLIHYIIQMVTEIGHHLSLLEILHVDQLLDFENMRDALEGRKADVYSCINDLITVVDNLQYEEGPSIFENLDLLLENSNALLRYIANVSLISKRLLNQSYFLISHRIDRYEDHELRLIQKRLVVLQSSLKADSAISLAEDASVRKPRWERKMSGSTIMSDTTFISSKSPKAKSPVERIDSSLSSMKTITSQSSQSKKLKLQTLKNLSINEQKMKTISLHLPSPFSSKDIVTGIDMLERELNSPLNENQIAFDMNGRVNAGSFKALAMRLTLHNQSVDKTYLNTFLMTFHQYGTATELFNFLKTRYLLIPQETLDTKEFEMWKLKERKPVQINVCKVLKQWIEEYWIEDYDDVCLDDIHHLASGAIMQEHKEHAMEILDLVQKRVAADVVGGNKSIHAKTKQFGQGRKVAQPILPKSGLARLTLLDLNPLEIARQLTLINSAHFLNISISDLTNQTWLKKETGDSSCQSINDMIRLAKKTTTWVVCRIVQERDLKRRAIILSFFIEIADHCLKMENYNTAIAIQLAFNTPSIKRLNQTWQYLTPSIRETAMRLKSITDEQDNFFNYTKHIQKRETSIIPYLQVHLTQLQTLNNLSDTLMIESQPLIHFKKYTDMSVIIQELKTFQGQSEFTNQYMKVKEIQDYLIHSINDRGTRNSQDLFDMSLRVEDEMVGNATQIDEKVLLLQKVGMI